MSLRDAALNVRENAYAPYSGFKVGAAIIGADGQVYGGVNVENVAYPEGTCAEAGAIAAMVAAGTHSLTEVYVIADSPDPWPLVVDVVRNWPNLVPQMSKSRWQRWTEQNTKQPLGICCQVPLEPIT